MIKIANAQLWVHDQDEALAFYTEKVGMEVRADVTLPEMGDFRWLTVGPAGPGRRLDHPDGDPGTAGDGRRRPPSRSARLMAKGFAGTVFLTTDDCQASYEELKGARGRVHRDARKASLRDRLRLPRPLGQQHPPHPGSAAGGGLNSPPPSSGGRARGPSG